MYVSSSSVEWISKERSTLIPYVRMYVCRYVSVLLLLLNSRCFIAEIFEF